MGVSIMKINNVQNSNYNNSASFGKLKITEGALENLLRYNPSKERTLARLEQLKKELADTKHWDLSIVQGGPMGNIGNNAIFTNKTNPKDFFYRKIRVAPISSLPKTVHIWSQNDHFIQVPYYRIGSLRFPTVKEAMKAAESLDASSRWANTFSVDGIKRLVRQTKILEQASEHMSKNPPTLLQKIELYLREKNQASIFNKISQYVVNNLFNL